MPFRILQVITPSRLAGAETLLVRMNARLAARGHAVRTACNAGHDVAPKLRESSEVVELPIGGKVNLRAVPSLRRASRDFKAGFTHSHLSTASWWCGWLQQFCGIPSLGHVHGFTSARWHRKQNHLIACSSAVKQHLVEQGIRPEKVSVLPNPVDADDVQPKRAAAEVRAEMGVADGVQVVGSFAHLSEKKGWRDLLESVPAILSGRPDTQFWWAGDGPLRAELEGRAKELGVERSIRFLGFRSDVADLMNAMDFMALPSHREPFGLVYVEAALLGKPSVACDAGGAPEVVVNGETGILVPPRDSEAIAAAILRLLNDDSARLRMGEAAKVRALELFGWEKFLDDLEAIYARL